MLVQQADLTRQVESITVNLRTYVKKIVRQMTETNPQNGENLCDYINAELIERNIADSTREWKVQTLTWLSACFKHGKTYRSMTKQDILLYLNSLRKTIDADPPQRWIGTYNNRVLVFTKFFRWLYKPNEPDYKKRKTPACMGDIKQLPKKTKTPYKPSDREISLATMYVNASDGHNFQSLAGLSGILPHHYQLVELQETVDNGSWSHINNTITIYQTSPDVVARGLAENVTLWDKSSPLTDSFSDSKTWQLNGTKWIFEQQTPMRAVPEFSATFIMYVVELS